VIEVKIRFKSGLDLKFWFSDQLFLLLISVAIRPPPSRGAIEAIAPCKTDESKFIPHDFVQLGRQHLRYKAILPKHCFVTAVL